MELAAKQKLSSELRQELDGQSALVLIEFSRLTVAEADDLRHQFREAGCTYRVYKNSTIRFAIDDTPHAPMTPFLTGMSGLAYNRQDPGAPARVARAYAEKLDKVKVKGGVMDGRALDASGVGMLADLPGPRELKAMLLALLNTPATSLVRVLNAPASGLLNVINAKKDKTA